MLPQVLGVLLQGLRLVAILASEVDVELPLSAGVLDCRQRLEVADLVKQFTAASVELRELGTDLLE